MCRHTARVYCTYDCHVMFLSLGHFLPNQAFPLGVACSWSVTVGAFYMSPGDVISHWRTLVFCQQSVCFDRLRHIFFFSFCLYLFGDFVDCHDITEKCQGTENKLTSATTVEWRSIFNYSFKAPLAMIGQLLFRRKDRRKGNLTFWGTS